MILKKLCLSVMVLVIAVLAGLLLIQSGCGSGGTPSPIIDTPAERQQISTLAGQAAMLTFIAIEHPTAAQETTIKTVISTIQADTSTIPAGGFASLKDLVGSQLAKAISDPFELDLATVLAGDLLSGLDSLFAAHTGWTSDTAEAVVDLGAFLNGASTSLPVLQQKARVKRHA